MYYKKKWLLLVATFFIGKTAAKICSRFLLYRKFLLNHELCKQIALQKQGTENRRLRLEDIKTFFSKIVIVDIIKFM